MSDSRDDREVTLLATLEEGATLLFQSPVLASRIFRNWIGREFEVTVKVYRPRRSAAQNRYWWGILIPFVRAFFRQYDGLYITKDEAHSYVKTAILGQKLEVKDVGGVEIVSFKEKSTSKMNTEEFSESVAAVQAFFAERGEVLPDPQQNNFISDFISE